MKDAARLSEIDVRAMVRLLGANCALKGDINDKRRHLMAGICRIIKADAWVWVTAAQMDPTKLPVYVGFIQGGFSEGAFTSYLKIQTHPDMASLTAPLAKDLVESQAHLTRSLQSTVDSATFASSDVYPLWTECGVYPRILSFYPLTEGIFSVMAVYRKCGRELCTDREVEIFHILTSMVPWLHVHQSPVEALAGVPKLPVRQRLCLELLMQGRSRKMIADDMGISINTVAGYIRDIYRFFGVTSQAQLVHRFYRGDGGEAGC